MICSDRIQADLSHCNEAYMSSFSCCQVVIYHFDYTFSKYKSRFVSFVYIATGVTFIFLIIKVIPDVWADSDRCLD